MTVDMNLQRRFNVIEDSVTRHDRTDAECVRYEYSMEERNNPNMPNEVLVIHDFGQTCRLPGDERKLVLATLSERHVKGKQVDPEAFPRLKTTVAETFFQSIQFSREATS